MNDLYDNGDFTIDQRLDCTGLRCPLPLLRTKQQVARLAPGTVLEVTASDAGALRDIPAWLAHTPHRLLAQAEQNGLYLFVIACAADSTSAT
ncbi:MAG: sulfurtransferase TusA family protein [Pseudomonadota bacterium]